jgi:hypothetical protein
MEGGVILAKFNNIIKNGDTKFCHGECQQDLPITYFPKDPGRFCKKCTSKNNSAKYHSKKKENSLFF